MKKYFTMLAVALFAIGCQKDNSDESLNPNVNPTGRYTDALSIKLGTTESRGSFDNELKWSWSAGDEIIGYQNSGEKERNTLSYDEGTTFSCDEFTYATTNAAKFHFIYPASAEQNNQTLVAEQSGTWNPILVGSTAATTLQNIGTVQMQHLTSALEVRAPEGVTITAASLTSENDFVGCWSVKDDLTYTQTLSGTKIELTELNNSVVVFNMPVLAANEVEAKAITLHLTTSAGVEEHLLPAMAFEAGKRTLLNIRAASSTLDRDKFRSEMETILTNNTDITAIAFKAKSSTTSSVEVQATDNTPIYLVENGTTLEVHTAAREFMAPEDSNHLFSKKHESGQGYYYPTIFQDIISIDLSDFNTSNVTNMNNMFYKCESLKLLNLSNFDTSKVTNMGGMFWGCNALTSVDLSNFDTSNVYKMSHMFYLCESIESLDLSSFNTLKVMYMDNMFDSCKVLTKLDLSNFKTSNVTDMSVMFYGCQALTELDLSNFDTSKARDMMYMFRGCKSLESLNISSFNTSNVTDMYGMFMACTALTELDLSSFDFSGITGNRYGDIFTSVGRTLTDPAKCAIWVSNDGLAWTTDKDLGSGNYEIKAKSMPQ